jgi:tetratricopeptide (TPR) repeat protein
LPARRSTGGDGREGEAAAMYTTGVLWTALGLWKTWQMGILLTLIVSLVSFILISRAFARRIEPRFLAIQRQIQAGQARLAITQLEELMPLSRWQVLLAGQIHAQIGLLSFSTGDEERAREHLAKAGLRAPEAKLALAALEYRRGRAEQAKEILDLAIRANKKNLLLYHVQAWMLSKEGARDAAIEKLLQCQKVEPGNEATQDNLDRLRNGKRLNMKRFGMAWFGLRLEDPPAELRAAQGLAVRKGFRQKPKRRR